MLEIVYLYVTVIQGEFYEQLVIAPCQEDNSTYVKCFTKCVPTQLCNPSTETTSP